MPTKLSPWSAKVHAHCLQTGQGINGSMAASMFGLPNTGTTSGMLHSAMMSGYFRREVWQEELPSGRLGRRSLYYALDKAAETAQRAVAPRGSYFAGVKRVSSVFDLAASL